MDKKPNIGMEVLRRLQFLSSKFWFASRFSILHLKIIKKALDHKNQKKKKNAQDPTKLSC
jgi:hypothetical protein